MTELGALGRMLLSAAFLVNAALVVLLLYRKNHRVFAFFFIYVLLNFFQGVVLISTYQQWGMSSSVAFKTAWATQSLVIITRALAVVEICRRILVKYSGIWTLGRRIFFAMGILVFAYSWAAGGHSWQVVAITADRSLELAIAVVILALLLFIRYYEVATEPAARLLAIGFFLFSCARVLNDTILERWLIQYVALWNVLGTASFLVSLLLWTWAMRRTQPKATFEPELIPENLYRSLSPAINARLKTLNEQLGHFWHAEGRKT